MKEPSANTLARVNFLFRGSCDWKRTGIGRKMIMMSDEMLKTAFVIMWFVSAEQFTVRRLCQSDVSLILVSPVSRMDSRSVGAIFQ